MAAERPATLGVRLLSDLRDIFTRLGVEQAPTDLLLEELVNLDESAWADLRGKPLDARGLSRRLREYSNSDGDPIKPTTIRVGETTPRGYRRQDLHDAWSRYLPPSPQGTATSATDPTPAPCAGCGEPMAYVDPGQTTHPGCDLQAAS